MKRTLRVLLDAETEVLSAALWYEEKRPGLGVEFVAIVDQALRSILQNPEGWPVWQRNRLYRKRPLKRFPYIVLFRFDSATVEIDAIAHAKRRPGYWLDRGR